MYLLASIQLSIHLQFFHTAKRTSAQLCTSGAHSMKHKPLEFLNVLERLLSICHPEAENETWAGVNKS